MIDHLNKIDLKGKKVILQLDFEEPIGSFRETINYLIQQSCLLIVIGSLSSEMSFASRVEELGRVTGRPVSFLTNSVFEKNLPEQVKNYLGQGRVVLLENLGFYPEEKTGDSVLAQALARLADFYVNECFSLSHMSYASLTQIPDFIESTTGKYFSQEIKAVERLREKPLTVVVGGDQVVNSVEAILSFLNQAEHILVSAKIAEAIFKVKGISPGRDWPEAGAIKLIDRLDITNNKIHLPLDVVTGPRKLDDTYRRIFAPGEARKEDEIFDIGPETIKLFSRIISNSPALLWRGPLGLCRWPEFSQGTRLVVKSVEKKSFSVVAGRETISFLRQVNLIDHFTHVSHGGEAMMRAVGGQKLPALKALSGNKLIG